MNRKRYTAPGSAGYFQKISESFYFLKLVTICATGCCTKFSVHYCSYLNSAMDFWWNSECLKKIKNCRDKNWTIYPPPLNILISSHYLWNELSGKIALDQWAIRQLSGGGPISLFVAIVCVLLRCVACSGSRFISGSHLVAVLQVAVVWLRLLG